MTRRSPFGFLSLSLSFVSFFSPQFSSKKTALLRGSAQQKLTTKNETDEYSTHFKIYKKRKEKRKEKKSLQKGPATSLAPDPSKPKKKKSEDKKIPNRKSNCK